MGAGRSLRKLAKDLELNPSTIAEVSIKHNWQERVTAFDAYIDKASQHNQIAGPWQVFAGAHYESLFYAHLMN